MPTPISSATRLLVHTAGSRIMSMSISGAAARRSLHTQTTANTSAATSSPITLPEPQPHSGASLSATSSATSQAESSSAGSQLIRPGVRTGDGGTRKKAATAATMVRIIGSQKSQCQSSASTIGPASTMPRPAPTALSEAMVPTAPETFSRGYSSRTMPKASGSTPPPIPCTARATIISCTLPASAASSEPRASAISVPTKTRSLPIMSPIRPMIGVKIEADSR